MNFRPRKSEFEVDINLTPLIDIVFLLVIFFMVTTTFSKEAQIKLELPEATSAEQGDSDHRFLKIVIDEFGRYAIQGAEDEAPRELINASHRTLQRALRQAAENMNDPVVMIRADRLTHHQDVVKAMDAARQEGLYRMTFSIDNAK